MFQNVRPFAERSVRENVMMGAYGVAAAGQVIVRRDRRDYGTALTPVPACGWISRPRAAWRWRRTAATIR